MFKVDQIIFGEVSLVKVTLGTINFLSSHLETATEQYSSPSGFPLQVQEQSKVKSTKLPSFFQKEMNSFSHKTCPWPTLPKPAALISINLVDWKLKIWPHFTFGQVGYLLGAVKLTLKRQMHHKATTQNHPVPRNKRLVYCPKQPRSWKLRKNEF